jgi:hypothetical protein
MACGLAGGWLAGWPMIRSADGWRDGRPISPDSIPESAAMRR